MFPSVKELQGPSVPLKLYIKMDYIEIWCVCKCVQACTGVFRERPHSLHQVVRVKTLTLKMIWITESRERQLKLGSTLIRLLDSKNEFCALKVPGIFVRPWDYETN